MPSLFPIALSDPLDLATPPGSGTIQVTTSYTLDAGDTLDLSGGVGLKLEVKNGSSVSVDIEGAATVDGGANHLRTVGVISSQSRHGDADVGIGATGSLIVTADGLHALAVGAALTTDDASFHNDGLLQVTASRGGAYGVAVEANDVSIHNTGVLEVTARQLAYGVYVLAGSGAIENDGELTVRAHNALGMAESAGSASMLNTGSIVVTASGSHGSALGMIQFSSGGPVTNGGSIHATASGVHGQAVGAAADRGDFTNSGSIFANGNDLTAGAQVIDLDSFDNSGSIRAVSTAADASFGLLFDSAPGGLITNSGVISGAFSVISSDAFADLTGSSFGTVSDDIVLNSGKLVGDVMLGAGSDGISNTGRIVGDIDLGDGGDILISNRGHLEGTVFGGLGNDNIEGSGAADTLYGDRLDDGAGGGDDVLRGMKGDDILIAGQGTDTLIGGEGSDTLYGGGADDLFKFTKLTDSAPGGVDLIADLTTFDIIDLHLIDADIHTGGDQAFHQVGAFSGAEGELTVTYNAGTNLTTVAGDVDGDGAADLVINITGDQTGYSEFVL